MTLSRLLVVLAVLVAPTARAADWLFLDLGEVVVTGNPTAGYRYVPGVREYIAARRAEGLKIALLSNIPEAWGATCGDKFATLRTFLGSRLTEAEPFDWTMFDLVVLPPFDRYRKPQPLIFVSALEQACPGRSAFIGESVVEVAAAAELGFATFHKTHEAPLPEGEGLEAMLATFQFQHPEGCDFDAAHAAVKLAQDADLDVRACSVVP